MIGRTLSHYKVLEEISRGGMGIVYQGQVQEGQFGIRILEPITNKGGSLEQGEHVRCRRVDREQRG